VHVVREQNLLWLGLRPPSAPEAEEGYEKRNENYDEASNCYSNYSAG
jgi:hypothetical protein